MHVAALQFDRSVVPQELQASGVAKGAATFHVEAEDSLAGGVEKGANLGFACCEFSAASSVLRMRWERSSNEMVTAVPSNPRNRSVLIGEL